MTLIAKQRGMLTNMLTAQPTTAMAYCLRAFKRLTVSGFVLSLLLSLMLSMALLSESAAQTTINLGTITAPPGTLVELNTVSALDNHNFRDWTQTAGESVVLNEDNNRIATFIMPSVTRERSSGDTRTYVAILKASRTFEFSATVDAANLVLSFKIKIIPAIAGPTTPPQKYTINEPITAQNVEEEDEPITAILTLPLGVGGVPSRYAVEGLPPGLVCNGCDETVTDSKDERREIPITITGTPTALGEYIVTQTFTAKGVSTAVTFTITVNPPPITTTITHTITSLALPAVSAVPNTVTLNLDDYFNDPDGELTYTATSTVTDVATLAITQRNMLTITSQKRGTSSITVTAQQGNNPSVSQTFEVAVPNSSPEKIGEISTVTLRATGASHTFSIVNNFRDPDGDHLSYSAMSSDGDVTTTMGSGGSVTVTAVGRGGANITVVATDGGGLTATQTFTVVVNIPSHAEHTGPMFRPDSFVTIWEVTAGQTITIPTFADATYSYTVNWGDHGSGRGRGSQQDGDATHTYRAAGTYTVSIGGTFPRIVFADSNETNAQSIIDIKQWGTGAWTSMANAFKGASNLISTATDKPNLSGVLKMNSMFEGATKFNGDAKINEWNVSTVINFNNMFAGASVFNQDISGWDMKSDTVTLFVPNIDMSAMFKNATAFNSNIGGWDVRGVNNFSGMFAGASAFNQNIGGWGVGGAKNFSEMFAGAAAFNQNIGGWDVRDVQNFSKMFYQAVAFNQDISGWDVRDVRGVGEKDMNMMFEDAGVFSQNLGRWYIIRDADKDATSELPETLTFSVGSMVDKVLAFDAQNSRLRRHLTSSTYTLLSGTETFGLRRSEVSPITRELYIKSTPAIPGTYRIAISASNPASARTKTFGTNNRRTLTITITDDIKPDAPVIVQPTTLTNNGTITITGTAEASSTVTLTRNGDTMATTANSEGSWTITVTLTAGLNTITATATDAAGNTSDISDPVTITRYTPSTGDFVTIWEVDAGQTITIPIFEDNSSYSYTVNWGTDQEADPTTYSNANIASHTYSVAGTYTVSIRGIFPRIYFNAGSSDTNAHLIRDIKQWGTGTWSSMANAFKGAINLNSTAMDKPNLSKVTDMSGMFRDAQSFNSDIGGWGVSTVTNFGHMFEGASAFNQDMGSWRVSNVVDMTDMFRNATKFNGDISGWDVSNVTKFNRMFNGASVFNQDLNWSINMGDNAQVNMSEMFKDAGSFNGNISGTGTSFWKVDKVTEFAEMFRGAVAFNQNIGGWNVSSSQSFSHMFNGAVAFNQDIGGWDVSSSVLFIGMFNGATVFNQDISEWDVRNAKAHLSMGTMFTGATAFSQNLGRWYIIDSKLPSTDTLTASLTFTVGNTAGNRDRVAVLGAQNIPLSVVHQVTYTLLSGTETFALGTQDSEDRSQPLLLKQTAPAGTYAIAIASTGVPGSFGTNNQRTLTITVTDEIPPDAPIIVQPTTLTNEATLTITGTAEASSTVTLTRNGVAATTTATATANSEGSWTITVTLTEGANTITATATDAADNVSTPSASVTITLDTVSDPPVIVQPTTLTNNGTITITGTAEASSTVTLTLNGVAATTTANSEGSWTITVTLVDGANTITATATDAAGNTSDISDPVTITRYTPSTGDFVTIWEVDAGQTITIPIFEDNSSYSYTVNWGTDQEADPTTYSNANIASHTYSVAGTYTVSIRGIFPRIYFNAGSSDTNAHLIRDIKQWGTGTWSSMANAFKGAINLNSTAMDKPNLSKVTDMSGMFRDAQSFNSDIGGWGVSTVTNFGHMFEGASAFNQDMGSWRVSNVVDMTDMFRNATKFNGDISGWDVSNVTKFNRMFNGASVFNQDLNWSINMGDNAQVNMSEMFKDAGSFNGNISGTGTSFWKVDKVTEFAEMFRGAVAFNQNIGGWNVSSSQSFSHMFNGAVAFNQDIGGWDVSSSVLFIGMFNGATVFNQDISEWDVRNAKAHLSMGTMFTGATAFSQNLGRWYIIDSKLPSTDTLTASLTFTVGNTAGNRDRVAVLGAQNIPLSVVHQVTYTLLSGTETFALGTQDSEDRSQPLLLKQTAPAGTYAIAIASTGVPGSFGTNNQRTLTITVTDEIPPDAPIIVQPTTLTNEATLTITGTAEASSTVTLTRNGVAATTTATATANSEGSWTITVTLTEGANTITATATDAADNVSTPSASVTITLDTVSDPPVIVQPTTLTNNGTITITGTAEASSTVTLTLNGVAATTTANSEGSWTITVTLVDGANTITATATDAAGNTSDISDPVTITRYTPSTGDFVTIWEVDAGQTITIPIFEDNSSYSYTVNWGTDQEADPTTYSNANIASHTYSVAGTYTVSIRGIFPRIYFNAGSSDTNAHLIRDIKQWGTGTWSSMANAFKGAINLNSTAMDKPNLSKVTDMSGMFRDAQSFNSDIGGWGVSTVTNFGHMFEGASAFNQDMGSWRVSNVVDMTDMFRNATKFNGDISGWDVSNVTKFNRMFNGASVFNQDLNWSINMGDNAQVNMSEMFKDAGSFNGNISGTGTSFWKVDKVTEFAEMFRGAVAFNQNIGGWNVSSSQSFSHMFNGAVAFNQDIGGWDVSSSVLFIGMFNGATVFNQDISEWDVRNAKAHLSMGTMFTGATAFSQNLGRWYIIDSKLPSTDTLTASLTFTVGNTAGNRDRVAVLGAQNIPLSVVHQVTYTLLSGTETFALGTQDSEDRSQPLLLKQTAPAGTYAIAIASTGRFGTDNRRTLTITVIDEIPPDAPVIVQPTTPTNNGTITITGTAEASSTVTLTRNGVAATTTATATANSEGSWTITVTLTEGANTITATATDAAGNVSTPSASVTITLDTGKPDVPVITAPTDNTFTNTVSVVLTGDAEVDSTVTLTQNGNAVTTTAIATANSEGSWTITVTLTDGANTITATATDAAGNVSTPSASVTITLDTGKPDVPVITAPTDNTFTNTVSVVLTGDAEVDSTVTLTQNGNAVTTTAIATANSEGSWTITVTLTDGANTITATATDAAGNVSTPSASVTITLDTGKPDVPVITAPTDNTFTNTVSVVLTGDAEVDSTVTLTQNGNAVTTTATATKGSWTITVTLTDGANTITATATDAAGNVSTPSASVTITLDTGKPDVPVITAPTDNTFTNTGSVVLTGDAEVDSTVTLTQNGNAVTTTAIATANSEGSWTITVTLTDGANTITATATDAAGNVSTPSASVTITLDTGKPDVPVITAPTDNTFTNTVSVVLTGDAEVDSTVTLTQNGNAVTTTAIATANSEGSWTITVTLTDGANTITATATDAAGNVSTPSASVTITLDTGKPDVPVITAPTDNTFTNTGSVVLTGDAEVDSTVTLTQNGNAVTTTATANSEGSWTITVTLTDGANTITATATDAAGNVSTPSASVTITLDTGKPDVPVITAPTDNTFTNTGSVVLTGDAEVDSTVTLTQNGNAVTTTATATANSEGSWTITVTLTDGANTITATATDAAGNVSTPSASVTITLDTGKPDVPVITAPTDNTFTNTGSVVLTGDAEVDSTVTLTQNGNAVTTTATANSEGSWTITVTLTDGANTITATATDAAGNVSTPSASVTITLDTGKPDVPVITAPTDNTFTNTGSVVLTGDAEVDSTVTLTQDGNAVTTTATATKGSWTITVTLRDGANTITATATDAAGNVSTPSASVTITLDTGKPDVPVITAPTDNTFTNTGSVVLTGDAEVDSTVTLTQNGNAVTTTATANSEGSWTITVTLTDGANTITATATDAAGNVSTPSASVTITLDTGKPDVPVITAPTDNTFTNTGSVVLTGDAEVDSTVTLTQNGNAVTTTATATANSEGSWTITVTLTDGANTITATATDAAGNVSTPSASVTITLDTGKPDVPVITAPTDNTFTNTGSVVLTGDAEVDSTVTLTQNGNAVTTTATANSEGSWTITVTLTDGANTITATATDAAGNVSTPSASVTITLDTGKPDVPVITAPTDNTFTNTGSVVLTGDAEVDSTVTLTQNGNAVTTTAIATANSEGSWTITVTLTDGANTITATATDAAGNVSTPSASVTITLDTGKPDVPVITAPTDNTFTNTGSVVLTGDAEVDSTVTLTQNGNAVTTTATATKGSWTITVTLRDGANTITATATDAAGNVSTPSASVTITLDTGKPDVPVITAPTDNTFTNTGSVVLTGDAEVDSTVTLTQNGNAVTTTATANSEGSWTITVTLRDGANTITATATDAAGNVSTPSASVTITLDTGKPDVPVITAPTDNTFTNTGSVVLTGDAEVDSTVTLTQNGNAVTTTATANSEGSWTITVTLTDGANTITATATDAAGNVSTPSASVTITLDTGKPDVPVITAPTDNTFTNTGSVVLTGDAEVDSTVTLTQNGNAVTTTATANSEGSWTITVTLRDGANTITATATDAAGNVSTPSASVTITLDTGKPDVPVITAPTDNTFTNTGSVVLTGDAEIPP